MRVPDYDTLSNIVWPVREADIATVQAHLREHGVKTLREPGFGGTQQLRVSGARGLLVTQIDGIWAVDEVITDTFFGG